MKKGSKVVEGCLIAKGLSRQPRPFPGLTSGLTFLVIMATMQFWMNSAFSEASAAIRSTGGNGDGTRFITHRVVDDVDVDVDVDDDNDDATFLP